MIRKWLRRLAGCSLPPVLIKEGQNVLVLRMTGVSRVGYPVYSAYFNGDRLQKNLWPHETRQLIDSLRTTGTMFTVEYR